MIECLAPALCRFDKYPEIIAQLLLTDEFVQGYRPD